MKLAVASMFVLGLAIILFAREIASFMIDDPEVIRLTVVFIYMLGGCQPLMAMEFTLGGSMSGTIAVGEALMFVPCEDGSLYALGPKR